jgi:DMSO/TMAO reductase YedYZ molybdopterin-dependent catalytic subunit
MVGVSRWHASIGGLAGGAAVAVGGAVLHTVAPSIPFPPIAIAQVLVRTTPGSFDSFFINRLGHWAARLAVVGTCIGFLAIAALLGMIIPPLARRISFASGPVAFVPLWVISIVLYPSTTQWAGRWRFAAITLPLYLAGGAIAARVISHLRVAPVAASRTEVDPTRRVLVRSAWIGAVGMLLGASPLSSLVRRRPDPGRNRLAMSATPSPRVALSQDAQFAHVPGLTPEVTSNDQFYVVNEDLIQPDIDPATWQLRVAGMVDHSLELTYHDLQSMPMVERYQTLECISNQVGAHLISNARWAGVPLAAILDRAGIRSNAVEVAFGSAGGYSDSMSVAKAMDERSLIAVGMNGFVLPRAHGFPARVLGVGTYGMKNPKWLTNVQVLDRPYEGFWEQRGWSKRAIVMTMSRIDTPTDSATVHGPVVPIAGIAFAGDRGISRVEVSTDGRRSWNVAVLKSAQSPFTWRLWLYRWSPAGPGRHEIFVRVYDGTGAVQTPVESPPFPNGASGDDGITVNVV